MTISGLYKFNVIEQFISWMVSENAIKYPLSENARLIFYTILHDRTILNVSHLLKIAGTY